MPSSMDLVTRSRSASTRTSPVPKRFDRRVQPRTPHALPTRQLHFEDPPASARQEAGVEAANGVAYATHYHPGWFWRGAQHTEKWRENVTRQREDGLHGCNGRLMSLILVGTGLTPLIEGKACRRQAVASIERLAVRAYKNRSGSSSFMNGAVASSSTSLTCSATSSQPLARLNTLLVTVLRIVCICEALC